MNKEEALALYESRFWEDMTYRERAEFQLFERLLCMPFGVFQEAVEKSLNRPVWTHEFADMEGLQKELLGEREPPTFKQICELIPEEKRMVLIKEATDDQE